MRLRRILTDTGVRSPASWEVSRRHAGWGPGAGRLGDTAGTERGAATAAYGGPFCQTSRPPGDRLPPPPHSLRWITHFAAIMHGKCMIAAKCMISAGGSVQVVDDGVAEVLPAEIEPLDGL